MFLTKVTNIVPPTYPYQLRMHRATISSNPSVFRTPITRRVEIELICAARGSNLRPVWKLCLANCKMLIYKYNTFSLIISKYTVTLTPISFFLRFLEMSLLFSSSVCKFSSKSVANFKITKTSQEILEKREIGVRIMVYFLVKRENSYQFIY